MLLSVVRTLLKIRFIRNVLTFQISTVVTMLTGLLSSVIYARILGVEQYGLFAVVSAFAGLLTIVAGWGQDATLATFLAEAVGKKDPTRTRAVLRYFLQSTLIAILIFIALIVAAPTLATLFQGNAEIGLYARLALFNTMLQPPLVLTITVLQLEHLIPTIGILENTRSILQLIIITILLLLDFGIWGILLGTTIVSLLTIPVCFRLYPVNARRLGLPTLRSILYDLAAGGTKTCFQQGFWIAADRHIARNLYPNLFFLVLNRVAPLETVGIFRLGLRLASLPAELVMPSITRLTTITLPRIAGESVSLLRRRCAQLIKGTAALMSIAILGALVFVPLLLPVIYGQEFTGATSVFLLLLPFNLISALNVASVPLARVFRNVQTLIAVNLTGIGLAILLFFLLRTNLAPQYAMGCAILYYHVHSLILYVVFWRNFRQHRVIES